MRREHALPAGVAALMLFGALAQHEYSYYTVLRWVVTVAALIVAWAGTRAQQPFVPLPFLMIAFLFNPLLPIVMDRQAWVVIDLICGALFAAVCVAELPPHDPPKAQRHGTPSPAVRPIALIEGTRPAREHQTHDPDLCGAGPPPPPVGATSLAFQAITPPLSPQTVAVRVDGGQITFAQDGEGHVTAIARGYNGQPTAGTVRRAREAVAQHQRQGGKKPWF